MKIGDFDIFLGTLMWLLSSFERSEKAESTQRKRANPLRFARSLFESANRVVCKQYKSLCVEMFLVSKQGKPAFNFFIFFN